MSEGSGYMRDVPAKDHGEGGDFFSYDRNEADAKAGDADADARGGDGYNRGDVDIAIGTGGDADADARGGDADADVRVYEEHHLYREYTEAPTAECHEHSHDENSTEKYPESAEADVY